METQLMTLKEVAERIQLNEKIVGRLAQKGEIAAAKVAGQWRFQPEAVEAWLARQQAGPVSQQVLPPEATGMPAPLVASAIRPERINLNLAGADRDAVLHELVTLVVPPREQHLSETLFKALKSREDLCSTCINEGVAIPHSRNALVGVVDEPVLAYGRHRAGLDFGSLDGKPVHHFFLLCAPNVRTHLQLLARLARLINRPEFRAQLDAVNQPDELLTLLQHAEQTVG